ELSIAGARYTPRQDRRSCASELLNTIASRDVNRFMNVHCETLATTDRGAPDLRTCGLEAKQVASRNSANRSARTNSYPAKVSSWIRDPASHHCTGDSVFDNCRPTRHVRELAQGIDCDVESARAGSESPLTKKRPLRREALYAFAIQRINGPVGRNRESKHSA